MGHNHRDWDEKLPSVAFAYRTSVHESTGFTPFYLMYGREASLPADLVYGSVETDTPTINSKFIDDRRDSLQEAYQLECIRMEDWKLSTFPVVRLRRPIETFVHFVVNTLPTVAADFVHIARDLSICNTATSKACLAICITGVVSLLP